MADRPSFLHTTASRRDVVNTAFRMGAGIGIGLALPASFWACGQQEKPPVVEKQYKEIWQYSGHFGLDAALVTEKGIFVTPRETNAVLTLLDLKTGTAQEWFGGDTQPNWYLNGSLYVGVNKGTIDPSNPDSSEIRRIDVEKEEGVWMRFDMLGAELYDNGVFKVRSMYIDAATGKNIENYIDNPAAKLVPRRSTENTWQVTLNGIRYTYDPIQIGLQYSPVALHVHRIVAEQEVVPSPRRK